MVHPQKIRESPLSDEMLRKCKKERVAIIAMNPVEFTITEDLK
jgi:hypothetical protein